MSGTYFFYDLETSGVNARDDRVMQFAGQRTDESLQPVGEPYNWLVTLSDDTLPSPQALMITGIAPQQTVADGYTEAEFCKLFLEEIATPDTTLLGFNSVRFDDEFMRALLWRNFYDPYEWSYADGRSRWDMLDVIRMARALRPEGIEWPVVDGKPTNRLELLAAANGVTHEKAHDALSDVEALIDVTRLLRDKQPQLFSYLRQLRDKNEVKKLVNVAEPTPFVYTSGRYNANFEKTTVAVAIAEAEHGNVYVYDLRHDPADWIDKTEDQLRAIIETPYAERTETYVSLPVKKLQYNRCPAVAPLGVLEQQGGWERIGLNIEQIQAHRQTLQKSGAKFAARVKSLLEARPAAKKSLEAEAAIYDGFVEPRDKLRMQMLHEAEAENKLAEFAPKFDDNRLSELYPRYKARNFPRQLSGDERQAYESYRARRLAEQSPRFARELQAAAQQKLTEHQQFVLEELRLWFEAIMPESDA